MKTKVVLPTLAEVEAAIGESSPSWEARCYEIAARIAVSGLIRGVEAVAVYGHWLGPVVMGSRFAAKHASTGFTQHGWIVLSDGRVLDPTRWVFEGRAPYLYVGPPDHYDEGGNKWREAMAPPMPAYAEDRSLEISPKALRSHGAFGLVLSLLPVGQPRGRIGMQQAHWIANRSPKALEPHTRAIYAWLERVGHGAFIPIDNKRMVERSR